ncbi:hypothetical protein G210_2372 [Candida maltosa Xu316]|uniref:Uncharacterized protein n=1 Tax=Candida maltosa (strain Xu316) TaxID=1245528 RepID=M3ILQ2_CANMX|nr:hypothetical protein G210_2372 [Candida maltosa Xu316]
MSNKQSTIDDYSKKSESNDEVGDNVEAGVGIGIGIDNGQQGVEDVGNPNVEVDPTTGTSGSGGTPLLSLFEDMGSDDGASGGNSHVGSDSEISVMKAGTGGELNELIKAVTAMTISNQQMFAQMMNLVNKGSVQESKVEKVITTELVDRQGVDVKGQVGEEGPERIENEADATVSALEKIKSLVKEAKRKDYDVEKISELSYVKDPSIEVERAFQRYYDELSSKENRTRTESEELSYFDVSKFPKHNMVKGIPSLLQWLKRLLHYKNSHLIPDSLIRDELEAAAARVNDEGLEIVMATTVDGFKASEESEPIHYGGILSYLEAKKPKIDYSEFLPLIDKVMKKSNDIQVLMVALTNVIDIYLRKNVASEIPKNSWIKLLKKLEDKIPEAMETIESQLPSSIVVKVRRNDGKYDEVKVDGTQVQRELHYIRKHTEKQITQSKIITVDFPIIWAVIAKMYKELIDAIPSEYSSVKPDPKKETDNKKSNEPKKDTNKTCFGCGKANHFMADCFSIKKLVDTNVIEKKGNKYCLKETGMEIPIKKGETLVALDEVADPDSSKSKKLKNVNEVEGHDEMEIEQPVKWIDQKLDSDDEEDDESYSESDDVQIHQTNEQVGETEKDSPTINQKKSVEKVSFSKSTMDRELTNLAKADDDYYNKQMANYLNEEELEFLPKPGRRNDDVDEGDLGEGDCQISSGEDQAGENEKVSPEGPEKSAKLGNNQSDGTVDDDAEEKTMRSTTKIKDPTRFDPPESYVLDKPMRRRRVGKYDEYDKDAVFDAMIENEIHVSIPLSKMIGIDPAFRKHLHESTRTRLLNLHGPTNAKVKPGYEVNSVEAVYYGVNLQVKISNLPFSISLLVDDGIPQGEVLLGLPFQNDHKFVVGFNDEDRREVVFKFEGTKYTIPLDQLESDEPLVVAAWSTEVKLNSDLKSIVAQCLVTSELSTAEQDYFLEQAMKYQEVFYQAGGPVGRLNPAIHEPVTIKLREHVPWKAKSIPLGSKRLPAVKILKEMLANDQLSFSDAPYRNPIFVIPKRDGSFRLLVDLRRLNQCVELEGGHPLGVDDITSELVGRAFTTLIDVKNAYYQIPLSSDSNDATSFNSPLGLLKFSVLPMGFTNSVSIFQNILSKILTPVSEDVLCFIDDIAVKGPSIEERQRDPQSVKKHIDKVIEVFQLLAKAGLKINPAKLKIARKECEFLGYHIGPNGKTLLKGQTEAIRNYPKPGTKKGMERFLGLVNYYRCLIPGFSELTNLLYSMATAAKKDKGNKLVWTKEAEEHFEKLKFIVSHEPVVTSLDWNQVISLHCDASASTWAGVLQNTNEEGVTRLVQCYSGKFHAAEANYSIVEKELYSIYNTLMAAHPLLVGYPGVIHIYCDNKAITQVLNGPLSNSHLVNRLFKWLNFIRTFNYEIHHIAGNKNVIADALTRCDEAIQSDHFVVQHLIDEAKPKFAVEVSQVSVNNSGDYQPKYRGFELKKIIHYLETLQVPEIYDNDSDRKRFIYRAHEFYVFDGELYKIGKHGDTVRKVILDPLKLRYLIVQVHDKRGHLKLHNAYKMLNQKYFIPDIYPRLKYYIETCDVCQKHEFADERLPLSLHMSVGVFHTVVIDTVYIQGDYLLLARDEFSGWCEAKYTTKLSADFVARFLFEDWICRFGYFDNLKSDNGKEFVNAVVDELLRRYKITHAITIPYHPMGNGMAERGNELIQSFLRKAPKGKHWSENLATALWADRTAIRSTTGTSAMRLIYGCDGVGNLDLFLDNPPKVNAMYSPEQLLKLRFRQLDRKEYEVMGAVKTQEKMKKQYKQAYDKRHDLDESLKEGDMVLLRSKIDKKVSPLKDKMAVRWSGPFRVVKIDFKIYRLESLDGIPMAGSFSRELLKKYHARNE